MLRITVETIENGFVVETLEQQPTMPQPSRKLEYAEKPLEVEATISRNVKSWARRANGERVAGDA